MTVCAVSHSVYTFKRYKLLHYILMIRYAKLHKIFTVSLVILMRLLSLAFRLCQTSSFVSFFILLFFISLISFLYYTAINLGALCYLATFYSIRFDYDDIPMKQERQHQRVHCLKICIAKTVFRWRRDAAQLGQKVL